MLNLPKTTEFNKRIPKQKFYENMTVSPALKKQFGEGIKTIYWRNKIAAATMNLAPGRSVTEIEVFEIRLNAPALDEAVLRQIDRAIPYHILFLLEYNTQYQAWLGYKEAAGADTFKVSGYYHTDWMAEDELPLKVEGLNLDAVYEGFLRQLAGDALPAPAPEESLQESIRRAQQRAQLEKQIGALQGKIRKERQLNKQMEMNTELKKLKRELAVLS